MNRNVESHFALNPTSLDVGRSQFDRSCGRLFTGNVGKLIPFFWDEVLPGDTFKVKTSKVIRLQTLLHPIFSNLYADFYWFFVPNRLVFDKWKYFCGESPKAWTPTTPVRIPKINLTDSHPHPGQGSLMDYMGVPLGIKCNTNNGAYPKGGINALPFRAYAKVVNDWFRDETLSDELVIPTGEADVDVNAITDTDLNCAYGGPVYTACKYHDYFTSCNPAPQSGPDTRIPIATSSFGLPVTTGSVHAVKVGDPLIPLSLQATNSALPHPAIASYYGITRASASPYNLQASVASGNVAPDNLWAGADPTMIGTINDLRLAFQVQKFYEKMARGRRYIEVLKSQFGVTSPDARLQRPEYLGGNRIPVVVSEVTNNSASDSATLGDLGAMSRTVDVHDDFVHSFTEHGILLGLMVLRYPHVYSSGLSRAFTRTTMFDYYWPVFANIGEQAVMTSEINYMYNGQARDSVFGYQEAWADYRFAPSMCMSSMRPEASGSLASWHLADYYDQTPDPDAPDQPVGPFLSDSWIREDASNVDRVLAVQSSAADQFMADIWIQNICTRVMPMYSIPGLADHH